MEFLAERQDGQTNKKKQKFIRPLTNFVQYTNLPTYQHTYSLTMLSTMPNCGKGIQVKMSSENVALNNAGIL